MTIRKYLCWIVLLLLLVAACKKPDFESVQQGQGTGTITGYLSNNFDFSLFVAAVRKAGLADSLDRAESAFTVLAPVNSAFNKDGIYQPADFDKWPTDSLRYFVRTHILPVKLFYSDIPLSSDNRYENLNGARLYVSRSTVGTPLAVNGVVVQPQPALGNATAVKFGITQLNGVIYPLITTLKVLPVTVQEFLKSRPQYSHLVAGLTKFGYWDQLAGNGPFTVFAPQDSCFERRGMTLDSISRMATSSYDPVVFGGYFLTPNHIFILDMIQLPPPSGVFFLAFTTPSPQYKMIVCQSAFGAGVGVVTAASASINNPVGTGPYITNPWGDQGTNFLGESRIVLSVTTFKGTYINYACTNGIVHAMADILVMPANVTK